MVQAGTAVFSRWRYELAYTRYRGARIDNFSIPDHADDCDNQQITTTRKSSVDARASHLRFRWRIDLITGAQWFYNNQSTFS